MADGAVKKRLADSVGCGLIAAFAVALVTQSAFFGIIALIVLGVMGGKIASELPQAKNRYQPVALFAAGGFFVVVVPIGIIMGLMYAVDKAGRIFGFWSVLGAVWGISSLIAYPVMTNLQGRKNQHRLNDDK